MSNEITLTDVELYDPIAKRTFGGEKTWCELRVDYLWGQSQYGSHEEHMKYWVHYIRIKDEFFNGYTFQVGQPFLIQTKTHTFPGIMKSFVRETELGDGRTHTYTFTFLPVNILDFVASLNEIVTEKRNGTQR
jgi:hypothetical protein